MLPVNSVALSARSSVPFICLRKSFSQLVDTLALRGFIERNVDPEDRRRMSLKLTARDHAAAEVVYAATTALDQELEKRLSSAEVAGLRRGLAVLGEIKELPKD
jgi:DNA-binding MarR family transcriptional regulator